MRFFPAPLCVCVALIMGTWPGQVQAADPCQLAVEPAATLLLPYFEVDLDDPNGLTTLFSINNASSEAALVNLTFWTDYGIPTFSFPIYLTGFDVATLNLRSTFVDGFVPISAPDAQDPDDIFSPSDDPAWENDFDGCEAFLPLEVLGQPAIHQGLLDRFRSYHSGRDDNQDPGVCRASDQGDGRVRGYVTIDNVNRCSVLFPNEDGYFVDGGVGVASNINQIWGDFYLIDPSRDFAQGDALVHVQAFDGVGEGRAWQEGDLTFYGRYVERSAIDNREPLPSVFGTRYLGDFGGGGGTELLVWRDTNVPTVDPVLCGEQPAWYPVTNGPVYDFDEQENMWRTCTDPGIIDPPPPPGELSCFRLATQRLKLGDSAPFFRNLGVNEAGWLYMDLNHIFDQASQAWVVSILSNSGRFSVGLPAAALFSPCDGVPGL